MVKGEIVVVVQKAKASESDHEYNLLDIIGSANGIRKIGKMWLTSVETNRIESNSMDHLLQNNIKIEDVGDMLPESLFEIVKERLILQPVHVEDSKGDDDMYSMLEKCNDAQRALSVCINEMRDCIDSASKVYRYCL